jgi:hypothetical protein
LIGQLNKKGKARHLPCPFLFHIMAEKNITPHNYSLSTPALSLPFKRIFLALPAGFSKTRYSKRIPHQG